MYFISTRQHCKLNSIALKSNKTGVEKCRESWWQEVSTVLY